MSKSLLYVLLAITFSILCLMANFTLNLSASEPLGFYRPTNEQLERNRLVLLREPLKRLVGVPGDHIRTSPEGTYVNGKLVRNSGIPTGSPYRPYPYATFVSNHISIGPLAIIHCPGTAVTLALYPIR